MKAPIRTPRDRVYCIDGDARCLQPTIILATDRELCDGEHFKGERLAGLDDPFGEGQPDERHSAERMGLGKHFSAVD